MNRGLRAYMTDLDASAVTARGKEAYEHFFPQSSTMDLAGKTSYGVSLGRH